MKITGRKIDETEEGNRQKEIFFRIFLFFKYGGIFLVEKLAVFGRNFLCKRRLLICPVVHWTKKTVISTE